MGLISSIIAGSIIQLVLYKAKRPPYNDIMRDEQKPAMIIEDHAHLHVCGINRAMAKQHAV